LRPNLKTNIYEKTSYLAIAIVAASFAADAQQEKNQLSIGPELGLSTSEGGGTFFGRYC
jgi:hypothetical protein